MGNPVTPAVRKCRGSTPPLRLVQADREDAAGTGAPRNTNSAYVRNHRTRTGRVPAVGLYESNRNITATLTPCGNESLSVRITHPRLCNITKKSSSPKILPLAPALCTYPDSAAKWMQPDAYGRLFECVVGGVLARIPGSLYYWRERMDEVDFVYENNVTYAIEVKSGRKKQTDGLLAFQKKFPDAKAVIVTPENFTAFESAPLDFLDKVTN